MAISPSALDIINRISDPVPDILANLAQLNLPNDLGIGFSGNQVFGSLSGVRRALKPFIMGLIPPDIATNFLPIDRVPQDVARVPSPNDPNAGLTPSFYRSFKETSTRLKAKPEDVLLVFYSESKLDPRSIARVGGKSNGKPVAKGLNQIILSSASSAGMTPEMWSRFETLSASEQLPYSETFLRNANGGRPYTSAAMLYTANFAPGKISGAGNPNTVLYSKADSPVNYEANKAAFDKENKGYITVGDLQKRLDSLRNSSDFKKLLSSYQKAIADPNPPKITGNATGSATFVMSSGPITTQEEDDPLRQFGRNIQISDRRLAAVLKQTQEVQRQIDAIKNTPGLLFLVNPESFTRSYEQSIDKVKTRRGHSIHVWLERPLQISCKGNTAAQYTVNAAGEGGLTSINRIQSLSYRNLLSLVYLYRNNGIIYNNAQSTNGSGGISVFAMSVFIYYDGHIYIGSFDNFSIDDSADKPYNMAYDFKFTARYDVEITSVADSTINRNLQF